MRLLLLSVLAVCAGFPQGQQIYTVLPRQDGTATGEVRFRELFANGLSYAGFKAPSALAANLIFTLPSTDGALNDCLTTNASKVLSFQTCGAGYWSKTGGVIHPTVTTDQVAVGTTSSGFSFSVYDFTLANDAAYNLVQFGVGSDVTLGSMRMSFALKPSATGSSRYATIHAGDNLAFRPLLLNVSTTGAAGPVMIGSNTFTFSDLFEVRDGTSTFRATLDAGRTMKLINNHSGGYSGAEFLDSSHNVKGFIGWANSAAATLPGKLILGTTTTTDELWLFTNSLSRVRFNASGLAMDNGGWITSEANVLNLKGATSINGNILLQPGNVGATSSVVIEAPRLDQPGLIVREASGVTTANSFEIRKNDQSVVFNVIGSTDAGAGSAGTVVARNIVSRTNNTYDIGADVNRWATLYSYNIDQAFTGACAGCFARLRGLELYDLVTTAHYKVKIIAGVTDSNFTIRDNGDTEIMRIDRLIGGSTIRRGTILGDWLPGATATYDMGYTGTRWKDIYTGRVFFNSQLVGESGAGLLLPGVATFENNLLIRNGSYIHSEGNALLLQGATATNGNILLQPGNVATNSSVVIENPRLDGPTLILRDASGTTTSSGIELRLNDQTVYFKVIGGTGAGAPGTVTARNIVSLTNNTYVLGDTTNRWNKLWVTDIDVEGHIVPNTDANSNLGSTTKMIGTLYSLNIDLGRSAAFIGSLAFRHNVTSGLVSLNGANVAGNVGLEVTKDFYPSITATYASGLATRRWDNVHSNNFTIANACAIAAVTGAPSGGCTTCHMRFRTDGGAGTTIYICEAGAWVAK